MALVEMVANRRSRNKNFCISNIFIINAGVNFARQCYFSHEQKIRILKFNVKLYNFLYQSYDMPKRQKSDTCSKGWCNNHLFSLTPIKSNAKFKKIQKVRLCPKLNKSTNNFQQTIPLLNKDQKHYTPSFILEEEQNFYRENDDRMLSTHLERVQSLESGPTRTIVIHFQSSVEGFHSMSKQCSLQPSTVENENIAQFVNNSMRIIQNKFGITQHISSCGHKEKIKKNRFMPFIHELCRPYAIGRQKIQQQRPIEETEECSMLKYMMGVKSLEPMLIQVQSLRQQVDDINNFD